MNALERITRAQPAWMARGECRTPRVVAQIVAGRVNFFPEKGRSAGEAKLVCAECSVRQQCYQYALAHPELDGIWGGVSRTFRKAERARAGAA